MKVPQLRLYDNPRAPSPRRVRIYLAEKGLEVERVSVDLGKGEQFSSDFASLNPFNVVPVLVLPDGRTIAESQAICRYFEARFPEPPLMGRDAAEAGIVEMWTRRIEHDGYLQAAAFLRHTNPNFAGRAIPGVREGYPQIPELGQQAKAVFARLLERLELQLADHPFVAGDHYSVADIMLLIAVDFGGVGDKRMELELPERVADWYERSSSRPSAKA